MDNNRETRRRGRMRLHRRMEGSYHAIIAWDALAGGDETEGLGISISRKKHVSLEDAMRYESEMH